MKILMTFCSAIGLAVALAVSAHANVKQLKTYREVYPDYKPNCIYCHINDKPKKEEGQHDLNAYGLKLQELMGAQELNADMVKSIGSHEEYKDEGAGSTTDGTTVTNEDLPAESDAAE